ncbi:MAG: Crp/Fnr family transcriptional regulator [Burkholderiaceae bacterium]
MDDACCQLLDPRQNQLLAALGEPQLERWLPYLEHVEMPLGQVLCTSGRAHDHAYFPTTAIVSLIYVTSAGASTETTVVGNEGVVGISLFLGGHATLGQAVVQTAGHGYRLSAQMLRSETEAAGPVLSLLLRYTLTMMAQVGQTAACNRYHSIDQLFCRRLVMALDRLPGDHMEMTQESAAGLLGVRREGVTAAAQKLQRDGVIDYRRGRVAVLNRSRLEARTCDAIAYEARP